MRKFVIITLSFCILTYTGCTDKSVLVNKVENKTSINTDTKNVVEEKSTPTTIPSPTIVATVTPTQAPIVIQPIARQGEKLDFTALDLFDNTKRSWEYTFSDRSINPTIKALIAKHDGVYIGDTSKKVIYLTFDEGYENGYTASILDTLKANNVKSIFFITGQYLRESPDLIKRMLDEGHLVGHHTINHPSMPTLDNTKLENELLGLEKQFSAKFNKGFKYIRPPMGEYSARTLEAAKQLGYKTVFWSFHYLDYDVNDQKGTEFAYNKLMGGLYNGVIMLVHAVSKDNAAALDRVIKDAKAKGYEFKAFDF